MKVHPFVLGASMMIVWSPAIAQTAMPAPAPAPVSAQDATAPAADAAPVLTDKEQKKLKQCQAMTYGEQQQSSKCQAVMKKAGVTTVAPQQPRQ